MKIKAKDLRIGNYHIWDGVETDVEADVISSMFYGGLDSEAIELNDKWYNVFGFKKQSNGFLLNYSGGAILITEDDNCILFSGSEYSLSIAMDYDTIQLKNKIKYVHNLQNIIFSLTEKELVKVN